MRACLPDCRARVCQNPVLHVVNDFNATLFMCQAPVWDLEQQGDLTIGF